MAILVGFECAGDRSFAFLSELVRQGKVSVAFYASIFVEFKYHNHSSKIAFKFWAKYCRFHVAA